MLGRIGRPGHRLNVHRTTRSRGIGWEFVHVCIDDCTRLAYVEILDDERKQTVTAGRRSPASCRRRSPVRRRPSSARRSAGRCRREPTSSTTAPGLDRASARYRQAQPHASRQDGTPTDHASVAVSVRAIREHGSFSSSARRPPRPPRRHPRRASRCLCLRTASWRCSPTALVIICRSSSPSACSPCARSAPRSRPASASTPRDRFTRARDGGHRCAARGAKRGERPAPSGSPPAAEAHGQQAPGPLRISL
jgi:hypothetical protein